MEKNKDVVTELAENHVDWFLAAVRPLLIDHFVHGFKHGASFDNPDIEQGTDLESKK